VLRSFSAKQKTMTLQEIAQATSLSKSSVQRMIYSLEVIGYVVKHSKTRRYHLTPKVMEIGNARTQGYAFNGEELFAGDMAVSAAIIGSQGLPIAALAIITPASRWSADDVRRQIVPQLLECTRSISNSVRAFT
jgi:DNA-binding IclR family transcriptional regulator